MSSYPRLVLADSKFNRYLKTYLHTGSKKVGLYGAFGHGDLGDDAIFHTAKDLLGPELVPVSKRCYAFYPRLFKAFLVGAGGSLRWECPYLPRKLLQKNKWSFPVVLFGAGVNCDYNMDFSAQAIDQFKALFQLCDYMTVRDTVTQRFVQSLGFSDVHLMPDLELLLESSSVKTDFIKKKPTIGIVLTPHSEFDEGMFVRIADVFVSFTDYLTEVGYHVLFLPFEMGDSLNIREKRLLQDIASRVRFLDDVTIFVDRVTPQEMLAFMRQTCDAFVCMRLHSAIFATNAGIPFFCVSYNQMHRGFMEMLGAVDQEVSVFDQFTPGNLVDQFDSMMRDLDARKVRLIQARDRMRKMIYSQIKAIKAVIS